MSRNHYTKQLPLLEAQLQSKLQQVGHCPTPDSSACWAVLAMQHSDTNFETFMLFSAMDCAQVAVLEKEHQRLQHKVCLLQCQPAQGVLGSVLACPQSKQ